MAYNEIICEKADRIATVTMNRPDKSNAWTPRMGEELREALLEADRDDNVRAIILTGAGKNFCAGADMGNLSGIAGHAGRHCPRSRNKIRARHQPGRRSARFLQPLRLAA
jgi:enoyl-CoA hydratase/carnithine racemase